MMTKIKIIIPVLLFCSYSINSIAQIKLPRLISDGLILQRNEKVKIWGWASPKEKINLLFKEKSYKAETDRQGNWSIILPAQKEGGPYEMVFNATNEITIQDIMFGDVWICSGQSNMELPMERLKEKYDEVIKNAKNSNIRQFLVPDKYDLKREQTDLDSENWRSADPNTLLNFSVVAYFFTTKIYEEEHLIIGLINSTFGDYPVQAWMSHNALEAFPYAFKEAQKY